MNGDRGRSERLRIAVTGLAVTYPFGGVFWDYMQYPLGLRRLGHDVLYIEDTGKWCYDPGAETFVESGSANAALFAHQVQALDPELGGRWFYRDGTGATYGRSWDDVARFCRDADLFIHVSASCWMREEYFQPKRVAFIDSDPMFTQASVPEYLDGSIDDEGRSRVDVLREHDVFFTFGENIGAPDCKIPGELFDWIPTRQPIVLSRFVEMQVPVASRRQMLTTVASWESAEGGRDVGGVHYGGKGDEFERFMDLPARSKLPLELAMAGRAPTQLLGWYGWNLRDGYEVSGDPTVYLDYLAGSLGEWSVAKNAYVASRSGWFSCRTACYLALGVPAIVQDTGFGCAIPVGDGILTFATIDEAADAIDQLAADPERHAKAARLIAEAYFDSDIVLGRLVEQAMR
jgi:hypothetical protein